ncbi:MAG: ExbD/TolR family protein [Thermoanaerobaculia bacterium]|nr:ExbD/TolR family protein [Thermoanaerobaculia bacterium]
MAFHMTPGSESEESMLADINVTPLVDVMLVLLIIFMITAPMLHQGIEVQLPEADAQPLPPRVEDPLVLSVNRDGLVYVLDEPVHPSQLVQRLQPILDTRGDTSLFLKADRELSYGQVLGVLDILNRGGIVNVGLVTQPLPDVR